MPLSETLSSNHPAIFLCSRQREVEWAVEYVKKTSIRNFRILAPTLQGQMRLRRSNLPHLQYFDTPYSNPNYYQTHYDQLSKQAHTLTKSLQKTLKDIFVSKGISLIDLCQVLLEYEIFEILHNYAYFRSLQKSWHPARYIVSSREHVGLNDWYSGFFSLAGYVNDYFVRKKQLSYFETEKEVNFLLLKNILKSLTRRLKSLPDIETLGEVIKQRIVQNNQERVEVGDVDFLLFSGGMNLYYYHLLFSRLREDLSLRFINITAPQILEDELLLRKANIPFKPLADFEGERLKLRITKDQEIAMEKIPLAVSLLKARLKDYRIPTQVKEALTRKVELLLKNNIHKFVCQIHLADEALTFYQPRLVITTHDPGPSALPFVLLAQRKKIPTLVLIHAWQNSTLGMDHRSDHVATWGKTTAEWYRPALKKDKKTVHEVGFPMFDEFFKKKLAFWQCKSRLPKLSNSIRLGLLLTVYPEPNFGWTKFLDELYKALANSKFRCRIELRTHRGQNLPDVEVLSTFYALPLKLNERIPLEQFVKQNDIIISWDTTAFLWAMLYGKPLFCTTPFWGKGLSPITKYKAAWEPNSAEELVRKIEQLKSYPKLLEKQRQGQRRFLLDVVGNDDGRSSERLLHLIKRLLSTTKRYEK